jgi:hypothetical protein
VALKNHLMWWNLLTPVDQNSQEANISILVTVAEDIKPTEVNSWADASWQKEQQEADVGGQPGGVARVMACSTCHVHLAPEWIELVGYPSEVLTQKIGRGGEGVLAAEDAAPQEELDMIDLANDLQRTSAVAPPVGGRTPCTQSPRPPSKRPTARPPAPPDRPGGYSVAICY